MEEENSGFFSSFFSSSNDEMPLLSAESELLSTIQTAYEQIFVELPNNVKVNTLVFATGTNPSREALKSNLSSTTHSHQAAPTAEPLPPLLLVHGYGSGVGQWIKNFDALARSYRVFACDLVGFGRSTREDLDFDAAEDAEAFFVHHLHDWIEALRATGLLSGKRKEKEEANPNAASSKARKSSASLAMGGQEKIAVSLADYDDNAHFLLCGHSLGAYVATAYMMRYHNPACRHLVLADPWGVPKMPEESDSTANSPSWKWTIVKNVSGRVTPFSLLRLAGPTLGKSLMAHFRSDLIAKFDEAENPHVFVNYLYHLNAQQPSPGENAFQMLKIPFAWAKLPLIERFVALDESLHVSFIYGADTWMDPDAGESLKYQYRGRRRIEVDYISKAGHHVMLDNPKDFNARMESIAKAFVAMRKEERALQSTGGK